MIERGRKRKEEEWCLRAKWRRRQKEEERWEVETGGGGERKRAT